jgi:16S rRNA (cytidine1402-2'-O)-methyltransferase
VPPIGKRDSRSTANDDAVTAAVGREFARQLAPPLAPGLYLVATPIGNLGDITLRALAVLARADIVYCEDTRHSAKLFSHFAIHAVTRPLHDHNEDAELPRILADLESQKSVAVISDAGTPLVSDPGFKLVRAAAAARLPVVAIPGASAVLTAMAASGLPTDAFFFAGFLPPKSAARRSRLADLADIAGSLIVFQAPQRLRASLADMADVLGNRPAVVTRELTKLHEDVVRAPLNELAASADFDDVKGEIVVVIGPPQPADVTDEEIIGQLTVALETRRLKDASTVVADALGVSKGRVYDLGLRLKDQAV